MKGKEVAVRRLQFSAGHRVFGHESSCANVHGHNYVVYLHAEGEKLDGIGRVIDFGVLKDKFGTWIDNNWDHGMLLFGEDPILKHWMLGGDFQTHKFFKCPFNPTAENMAKYLLHEVGPALLGGTKVRLSKVVLYETENCFSEATL